MTIVVSTCRAIVLIAALSGCGGDPTSSDLLSVSGTYATAVALVPGQNTCTGVTVADNPTVVDQTPGALTLGLTHAGTRYDGQLQASGQFTAGPKTLVVGGVTYLISLSGQFAIRGFTATVVVQQTPQGGGTCSYQVAWTGAKQGSDNVIP